MNITELWEKNKTWVFVLLIFVGAYLVISPVRTGQYSMNEMGAADAYYASSKGVSFDMPSVRTSYSPPMDNSDYYPEEERKIQKTSYINLEVEPESYASAVSSLDGIITKYSGYYTSKNERKDTYGEKDYRTYTITIKVPVDKLENAVSDLRNVAEVKSVNVDSNDMTTQYYDTKAYLDNYKKEKSTLQALYDRADKIEDIIKIQERLSQVQSQIDSYEMQLRNIERVTDYSTIYVTMSEKRDIITNYYEMTGLGELWRNIVMSFDSVFVFISQTIGFVVIFGLVYLGYKGVKRIIKK